MLRNAASIVYFSLTIMLLGVSTSAIANDTIAGIWKTESSERGYLHVKIEPCEEFICGTILTAYDLADQPNEAYEHLGENIIWDMNAQGPNSWNRGKIWDPTSDKTYKSKMSLNGNVLSVSGCIAFFCKAQDWTRVE